MTGNSGALRSLLRKAYHFQAEFISNVLTWIQIHLGIYPSFIRTAWAALQEWKFGIKKSKGVTRKDKSIVLVAFRNTTWIEWSVFAAYKVYSMGYRPIILYSSSDVEKTYGSQFFTSKVIFNFWRSALKSGFITFIDFDAREGEIWSGSSKYSDLAKDLAHTMAAYNLRVEEFEEDVFTKEYRQEYERSLHLLMTHCPKVENILSGFKGSRIICPNGLIEKSVVFHAVSRFIPLDIVFIETWARRWGHMIWGFKKPVMFYDIRGWKDVAGPWDNEKEKDFRAMINFQDLTEVNDEDWFKGFIPVQRSTAKDELPENFRRFLLKPGFTFLLGTNVIGDSATLRRGGIFKNQKKWLREILTFFGRHPELKLVIRIHPDEIFPKAKVKIGEIISPEVNKYPNVFLFKAEHDINTNSLVEHVNAGLAWVSNIGVDMVLRGKQVVVAGKSNYMHLGVGLYPENKTDYFDLILSLAMNPENPSPKSVENAKIYQRIVFKEMSLEASGKNYLGREYRLKENNCPSGQTKFYQILCGELDCFGRLANE
jgi:hypothetical protein